MILAVVLYFLLGFTFALIIFGIADIPPLLHNFHIRSTIPGSWPEFLTAIGTMFAVIVALFGELIRSKLFPSKIRMLNIWENIQGDSQGHTRLLFRNIGSTTAYEVEVYVNRIIDDGRERQGFLPVPLIWTHTADAITKRDLHPKQFGYYLDLCRIDDVNNPGIEPKLPLIFGAGVKTYQDIYHGRTTLELVVSQKSGDLIFYDVDLEWIKGQDKFVRVLEFTKR